MPPMDEKQAHQWGMFCHLAALSGFIIPMGWIVGPLILWLMKKQEHPFIDACGKEAVNFQITVVIAFVISFILCFVIIGFILLPIVAIGSLIFVIMASVKASDGEEYQYPLSIRWIK